MNKLITHLNLETSVGSRKSMQALGAFPQEPLLVACLVTCLSLYISMLS